MTGVTTVLLVGAFVANFVACTMLGRRKGQTRNGVLAGLVLGPLGIPLLAWTKPKPAHVQPSAFWYQRPEVLVGILGFALYGALILRLASGAEDAEGVVDGSTLARDLHAEMAEVAPGGPAFTVRCPEVRRRQGQVALCDVTSAIGTGTVRVTLLDDDGHFTWEPPR